MNQGATFSPARDSFLKRLGRIVFFLLFSVILSIGILWFWMESAGLTIMQADDHAVPLEQAEIEAPVIELPAEAAKPKNVIVFVADGLGFAHLSLARATLHGINGQTVWDRFTSTGWHRAHPERGFLIDSAASATALSTGVQTSNGAVGVDATGSALTTLMERASELSYRTGIVTDSYIWDATPAAFAAHRRDRDEAEAILQDLAHSSLDVLFGELEDLGEDGVPEWEPSVAILRQRFEVLGPTGDLAEGLAGLDPAAPVAAIYEEDQVTDLNSTPTLPSMIEAALERLDSGESPFVLLVESEEPDSASHDRNLKRLLRGMAAIEASLEVVLDFADRNGETLVVFTSDHETGGLALSVEGTNTQLQALWSTSGHTGVSVPVLAIGPGSEHFVGIHNNAFMGRLLAQILEPGGI